MPTHGFGSEMERLRILREQLTVAIEALEAAVIASEGTRCVEALAGARAAMEELERGIQQGPKAG
ncbi:MAG: hypothetical protein Q8P18_21430 [Pseudomonadota bacterium]|nr:hypothetical protein [Pseudomonadota bacterium]